MAKTRLSIVADLSKWTVKMLQIKYNLCLRPSVKTSNSISGTLMSDIETPSAKLQKTLKPRFPSANIDPRKIFKICYMFCDELFSEPTMS